MRIGIVNFVILSLACPSFFCTYSRKTILTYDVAVYFAYLIGTDFFGFALEIYIKYKKYAKFVSIYNKANNRYSFILKDRQIDRWLYFLFYNLVPYIFNTSL